MDIQKLYIDSAYSNASSKESFPTRYPGTGEVLCEVQCASLDDIDRAVNSAKQAFLTWSKWTGAQRGRVLWKAAQLLRERAEPLAKLETLDSGKPISESRLDIISAAEVFEYYAGLAHAINGEYIPLGKSFAYTKKEALGVCAGIGAWNFPITIASWKIAPALACGNTFVFKPSELTPLTALQLAEILTLADLPSGVLNVINGPGYVGDALIRHPDIAKVSITGSVPTGKTILKTVAEKLTPVTLELGGKSPLIVFKDCNFDHALTQAMLANFYCQGEVCSNGTRVFVEEHLYDRFLSELSTKIKSINIGDPLNENTTMGALISNTHRDKVINYINTAQKEGAHLLCGGEIPELDAPFHSGYFLSPTVFTECKDDMTHVKEEIFGPVMSVLSFKNEEEVIHRANNTSYGLGASVFTQDLQKAHRVVDQLQAGNCWINTHNLCPVEIPFGGFKQSGIGRENGTAVLNHYTQIKTVYVDMSPA